MRTNSTGMRSRGNFADPLLAIRQLNIVDHNSYVALIQAVPKGLKV